MPRKLPVLMMNPSQQEQIRQWLSAHGTPQQLALGGRIVLAAAQGHSESAIARQWGTNRKTVTLWRTRFAEHGLESLWQIAPGRGRKPTYGPEKIKALVEATLQTKPPGMTHWSCRLMAKAQGVSKSQHLVQSSGETAPGEALQAVARPQVSGEADRRGGPLSESSPAGRGDL